MDALSHSLEAFCSPLYQPLAEGVAVEGMRLIKEWLPIAVADGGNLEARSHMLIASSMGATAFQKGLGAMHSLSHPCSAHLNTHHGLTNAFVMPYVLVWNRRAIEDKMQRLAAFLELGNYSFDGVLEWVLDRAGLRAALSQLHQRQSISHALTGIEIVPLCRPERHIVCIGSEQVPERLEGTQLSLSTCTYREADHRALSFRVPGPTCLLSTTQLAFMAGIGRRCTSAQEE